MLASLSPVKPSRYFDAKLADGQSVIRLVGFDKAKRQELQSFSEYNIPVTLKDCLIQKNKFESCLEVVIKSHTKIEPSTTQFNVPDIKTVGSSIIQLNQLKVFPEHERVTIKVNVVKVHEPQTLNGGKRKQEVLVADCTGKVMITLWEADIGRLELHKLYQLNRLEIRTYQGKYYLSFPSTASVDCISDIKDAIDVFSSEDDDEEHLHAVTISGIKQLETVYVCVSM